MKENAECSKSFLNKQLMPAGLIRGVGKHEWGKLRCTIPCRDKFKLKNMLLCVSLNKQCFFNTINSLLLLNAAFSLESPELCGFGFVLHLQQVKAAARKESCSLPLFPPKAQRSTNAAGLCKLSSHAPLSGARHIFSMKEILYLLFVALVTKPLHHCLFVTWGLEAFPLL